MLTFTFMFLAKKKKIIISASIVKICLLEEIAVCENNGANILVSLIYNIKFNGLGFLLAHFAKIQYPFLQSIPNSCESIAE